jgi:hypothetical protein
MSISGYHYDLGFHVYRSGKIIRFYVDCQMSLTRNSSFLTPDFSITQRQFTIWQNAVETFRGCQQDLDLAPARIIAQRVESAWDLSLTKTMTPLLTSDHLPSRMSFQDVGILPNNTEMAYALHWQNDLSMYTNDLNVYV